MSLQEDERAREDWRERLRPTSVMTVDTDDHARNFALQDNGVGTLAASLAVAGGPAARGEMVQGAFSLRLT